MGIFSGISRFFNSIGNGIKNGVNQIGGGLSKGFNAVGGGLGSIFDNIRKLIDDVKTIIRCLEAFFKFVGELLKFSFNISAWFFTEFIPWLGQYLECALDKIISLPKCFLWYTLDTISYILYLPVRFGFWLIDSMLNIGIQKIEKDIWCFLDDIDKFIHDSGNDGLGTGIHIIHFPDSVMQKCYQCKASSFPKLPNAKAIKSAYIELKNCKDKGKDDQSQCKKCNDSDYFQQ